MKTHVLIERIAEFSLLALTVVIVSLIVVLLISKRRRKNLEQNIVHYEVDNNIKTYKKGIEKLKNLSMDHPDRMRNLKLVFRNIESIRESKYNNDVEKQICMYTYYEKKKMIRQIAYNFVYDLLCYFSEKYNCYKAVELLSLKKVYKSVINYNDDTNFVAKFDAIEVLLINFSDISINICEKMTEVNFKKEARAKCRNKILKESFELEEMVLKLKLNKANLNIQNYTKVLELFEHKMLSIIELFNYIEKNE